MVARLILLSVLLPVAVLGQQCSRLQESELGDTSARVTTGLLAEALGLSSGDGTLTAQLQEFNIVCLAQGDTRDTYRSLSLIATYINNAGDDDTTQLDLQCENGVWSASQISASSNPTGNLTTPLRTDCYICFPPTQLAQASDAEHCVACDGPCTGLTRCTGTSLDNQTCCNFFGMSDSCVTACPADSTPNAESTCMCDAGFLESGSSCVNDVCDPNPCGNGTCMAMNGAASCTCDMGFEPSGGTCVEMGSSVCEPNPCGNGTCVDMGNDFSCMCNTGFEFTDRTCVAVDPISSVCEPNPCQDGGTCAAVNGAFSCTCRASSTGARCEECNDGYVQSSSGNCREDTGLSTGARIAIGVVIGAVALIAIVTVIVHILVIRFRVKDNLA